MPELPEVETIVRELRPIIIGRSWEKMDVYLERCAIFNDVPNLPLGKITAVERRGKYIIIYLDGGYKAVVHLRMTGKLVWHATKIIHSKYTRTVIVFAEGGFLTFEDIRTFGGVHLYREEAIVSALTGLGVEPLTSGFSVSYLREKLQKKMAPIKTLLLNQAIVAGLGNIYVVEILYRAKVRPDRSGKDVKELGLIVEKTKEVLEEAINHNGTTISDYRRVDDKTGDFQNFLRVYQKENCPLGHPVTRFKQAGRTTYFCEKCQK